MISSDSYHGVSLGKTSNKKRQRSHSPDLSIALRRQTPDKEEMMRRLKEATQRYPSDTSTQQPPKDEPSPYRPQRASKPKYKTTGPRKPLLFLRPGPHDAPILHRRLAKAYIAESEHPPSLGDIARDCSLSLYNAREAVDMLVRGGTVVPRPCKRHTNYRGDPTIEYLSVSAARKQKRERERKKKAAKRTGLVQPPGPKELARYAGIEQKVRLYLSGLPEEGSALLGEISRDCDLTEPEAWRATKDLYDRGIVNMELEHSSDGRRRPPIVRYSFNRQTGASKEVG